MTILLGIDGHACHVDTTDSSLWLSSELLEAVFWHPEQFVHVTVTRAEQPCHGSTGHSWGEYDCAAPPGSICFKDAIVKINNGVQTWVYKVDDYDMCKNGWLARWPD